MGLCITPEIDQYILSIAARKNDADDNDDQEEDEQSLMNVRKLLTVNDQHKLLPNDSCDKKGFEDSATLNMNLDTVTESNAFSGFSMQFRQLSESVEDDGNMDFDPNMAPPSSSNATSSTQSEQIEEEKEIIDAIHSIEVIPTKAEFNKLTAKNWEKLIYLRKRNLFPQKSSSLQPSIESKEKDFFDSTEQKLATITNPLSKKQKKAKKKSRHRRITPPTSQGIKYWKYSCGINEYYVDYDIRKNKQLHAYDFNWDKHGYAVISRYYPGIEKKMDAVFNRAKSMTDNSINSNDDLDTEPFRLAVWHYTFRLYGVQNDSYQYGFVNMYLPVKLKIFIKKLVCYPQIVTIDDVKK